MWQRSSEAQGSFDGRCDFKWSLTVFCASRTRKGGDFRCFRRVRSGRTTAKAPKSSHFPAPRPMPRAQFGRNEPARADQPGGRPPFGGDRPALVPRRGDARGSVRHGLLPCSGLRAVPRLQGRRDDRGADQECAAQRSRDGRACEDRGECDPEAGGSARAASATACSGSTAMSPAASTGRCAAPARARRSPPIISRPLRRASTSAKSPRSTASTSRSSKGRPGEPDRLLYAGLDRAQYSDVQVMKWTANGQHWHGSTAALSRRRPAA